MIITLLKHYTMNISDQNLGQNNVDYEFSDSLTNIDIRYKISNLFIPYELTLCRHN